MSRWPQVGSQRRLRWSRRARPAVVGPGAFVAVRRTGLGLDPPPIGPVEMAAGRLPAQAAVVSTGSTSGGRPGCLSLRCVGWGWDRTHRPSGLSRWPQVGSQRRLRWSRRARPAVVGPGAFRCGASDGAGTGPTAHRACRDGRRSAPSAGCGGLDGLDQRWSARVPSLRCVGRGWDWTTVHRACRDGRRSAPSAGCGGLDGLDQRWSARVPSLRCVGRGWDWTTAHRACRDGRRSAPSAGCGGLDGLDQRWSARVPSLRCVGRGWDWTTAHRACRDGRRSAPSAGCGGLDGLDQRWSARVPFVAVRRTGLGLDHRPSSLSRWPQGGLGQLLARPHPSGWCVAASWWWSAVASASSPSAVRDRAAAPDGPWWRRPTRCARPVRVAEAPAARRLPTHDEHHRSTAPRTRPPNRAASG